VLGGLYKGQTSRGRECENCVLTADCVRGLDKGSKGKGLGDLCVDSRLC